MEETSFCGSAHRRRCRRLCCKHLVFGSGLGAHADTKQTSFRTDSLRTVQMVVLLLPMRCSASCSDLLTSSNLKTAPVGLTYW